MDNNSNNNKRPNQMPPPANQRQQIPPGQRRQMPPPADMRQRLPKQQIPGQMPPRSNNGMNSGMYGRVPDQRMQRNQLNQSTTQFNIQRPQNKVNSRKDSGIPRIVIIPTIAILSVLFIIFVISLVSGKFDEGSSDNDKKRKDDVINADVEVEDEDIPEGPVYPVSYATPTSDTVDFPYDKENLDFEHGILIDLETNTIVATRKGDEKIYPASMTKVMTLIVVVENAASLDDTVTITDEMLYPLVEAESTRAGFDPGETVTVRDLIYGLILPSGGDAAVGLSTYIAGSEEAFAVMMNEKVAELGLTGTHFTNSTGLHDPNHYSTCHDIALMVEYAIKDEFMKEVLCTYKYTTAPTEQHPEGIKLASTMLSLMYGNESGTMFVQGGKTGYTQEGKNCLVSFATKLIDGVPEEELKKNDTRYVLVTARSDNRYEPIHAAIAIYKQFYKDPVAVGNDEVTEKPAETTAAKPAESDDGVKIYTAAPPKF